MHTDVEIEINARILPRLCRDLSSSLATSWSASSPRRMASGTGPQTRHARPESSSAEARRHYPKVIDVIYAPVLNSSSSAGYLVTSPSPSYAPSSPWEDNWMARVTLVYHTSVCAVCQTLKPASTYHTCNITPKQTSVTPATILTLTPSHSVEEPVREVRIRNRK